MSDPGPTRDTVDAAYVEAEALLADEAARAARRARVLAAVEQAGAAAPARRPSWRPARWVAGACAASLAIFFVVQVDGPDFNVAEPEPEAVPAPPAESGPAPAAQVEARGRVDAPGAVVEPREETRVQDAQAPTMASPPPPAAAPQAFPLSPRPAPADSVAAGNLGSGRTLLPPAAQRPTAPVPERNAPPVERGREDLEARGSPSVEDFAHGLAETAAAAAPPSQTSDPAASLRAAAAAGRAAEVERLLAQGLAVDAPDTAGNTALMLAVQSRRPYIAALLQRRGASLDRRNQAGLSARDMARALADPELNRALGLDQ